MEKIMRKMPAIAALLTVLFSASSAFACGFSFETPQEIALLSLFLASGTAPIYSFFIAIFLMITRKKLELSFKHATHYWIKGSFIAFITSAISMIMIGFFLKFASPAEGFIVVFVATMPVVALSGYFTRAFYSKTRKI